MTDGISHNYGIDPQALALGLATHGLNKRNKALSQYGYTLELSLALKFAIPGDFHSRVRAPWIFTRRFNPT